MYYFKLMWKWVFGSCPHWWSEWSKPARSYSKSLYYHQYRTCEWCGIHETIMDSGDIGDFKS